MPGAPQDVEHRGPVFEVGADIHSECLQQARGQRVAASQVGKAARPHGACSQGNEQCAWHGGQLMHARRGRQGIVSRQGGVWGKVQRYALKRAGYLR